MRLTSRLTPELRAHTPPEVLTLIDDLVAEVAALQNQVRDLQARLRQDSTNSSRPPSSDGPLKKARRPRRRGASPRRPGGQPGHEPAARDWLPPEELTDIIVCKPEVCRHCHGPLHGSDELPLCHQVTEVPALPRPEVREYQRHILTCRRCGQTTMGALPEGVGPGAFGPRLQALVAVCTGCYHLSKRQVEELLADCFGVTISLGSISTLEQATSQALAAPVAAARQAVQTQAVVHVDETGWQQPDKAWLWAGVTTYLAVFSIRNLRDAAGAIEILGLHFGGILVSDRFSSYNWLPNKQRQLCWAHLRRDWLAFIDRGGASARLGQRLLTLTDQMFHEWHRVRDGTLPHRLFQSAMRAVRREVGALLRQGARGAHRQTAGTCADILKREEALWTFVDHAGVEPTNNAAERALRPAVLWRKKSFGTQSRAGSVYVERMLSVVTTCRLQGRNVLEYVTAACQASRSQQPAPSLLPEQTPARKAG